MAVPGDGVHQLVVPVEMWADLTRWLRDRGWVAARIPEELLAEDEVATYVLQPSPETLAVLGLDPPSRVGE